MNPQPKPTPRRKKPPETGTSTQIEPPRGPVKVTARELAEETFFKADRKAMTGPRFAVPGWPGHAIAFIDAFTDAIEARDTAHMAELEAVRDETRLVIQHRDRLLKDLDDEANDAAALRVERDRLLKALEGVADAVVEAMDAAEADDVAGRGARVEPLEQALLKAASECEAVECARVVRELLATAVDK